MSVCGWVSHAVAGTTCQLWWALLTLIFAQSEIISHYIRTTIAFIFHPETFKALLQHLWNRLLREGSLWGVLITTTFAKYWLNFKQTFGDLQWRE